MSRLAVAVLAGSVVLASADSEAAPGTKSASKPAKPASTSSAQQPTARAKQKQASSRRRASLAKKKRAKKRSRSKGKRSALAAVSTSKEGLPAGFSWPPNAMMKTAAVACEQNLDGLGMVWERATPQGKIADPIYVPSMEIGGIKYVAAYGKGPRRLDCQLVKTLADVGPQLYALGVREIRYRNTNVRVHGMTKPILSRHALGIAMDIKAFVDDQGRVANVELDYLKGDPLLHGIEDTINQTHKFRIVLTPGNDPLSHYDHFHIEAAVDYTVFVSLWPWPIQSSKSQPISVRLSSSSIRRRRRTRSITSSRTSTPSTTTARSSIA
jgi:hypothetical protein